MQHRSLLILVGVLLILVGVLLIGQSSCYRRGRTTARPGSGAVAKARIGPVDVSVVTQHPDRYHDRLVHVRGVVASICQQEGCFIDIVPLSGQGEGVLVSGRQGPGGFPQSSVGRIAEIKGTFYTKVYPFSRMHHWQHHSWRAGETRLPPFARIHRIEADSVTFRRSRSSVPIRETPLEAYTSPIISLDRLAFESARMGTGKKR